MTGVLILQSFPSRLSISRSALPPLVFELLDEVFGGTGCGKNQNALEVLVRLFPFSLGKDVERRGVADAQNKQRLVLETL